MVNEKRRESQGKLFGQMATAGVSASRGTRLWVNWGGEPAAAVNGGG